MTEVPVVIDMKYRQLNVVRMGYQECPAHQSYGPAARPYWLIHFVFSGRGMLERDGEVYSVGENCLFVIPADREAKYYPDAEEPWKYAWIGFTAEELPCPVEDAVIFCPKARTLFQEMRKCGEMSEGRSAFLTGKLWELFSLFMEGGAKEPDLAEAGESIMLAEFSSGITVGEVAEKLNVNRSYFSTLYRQKRGISPQEHLKKLRMEYAAKLMSEYGKSPSVAAFSTGYSDLFAFSKAFKAYYGVPPREYRNGKRKPE